LFRFKPYVEFPKLSPKFGVKFVGIVEYCLKVGVFGDIGYFLVGFRDLIFPLEVLFKERFEPPYSYPVQEGRYEVGFSFFIFELNVIVGKVGLNLKDLTLKFG
jgi:hypothetical protein